MLAETIKQGIQVKVAILSKQITSKIDHLHSLTSQEQQELLKQIHMLKVYEQVL